MPHIRDLVREEKRLVDPEATLSNLKEFIVGNDRFIIFGASEGGISTKSFLDSLGKEVVCFLDNDPLKEGSTIAGIKVIRPDRVAQIKDKILIASDWFVEIGKQLSDQFGLKPIKDYVPLYDLKLFLWPTEHKSLGVDFILDVENHIDDYQRVLNLLEDARSRDTYYKVLKYRMRALTPALIDRDELPGQKKFGDCSLTMQQVLLELPDTLGELKPLFASHYTQGHYPFQDVREGDTVIDGGAWKGDSAYWFSKHAGPRGRVFSFEPGDQAYAGLVAMITANNLGGCVVPVKSGLGTCPGQVHFYEIGDSTACSFADESGNTTIDLTSIDNFVEVNNLQAVNFIKLDIEGGELEAIIGSRKTIEAFRPNLAVCVYHKAEHLYAIPRWIHESDCNYKIYISHHNISPWDTLCYAVNRDRRTCIG